MLDAAREALSFVGDKSRSELDANRMLTLSLVKSIEIVGEAASRVSSAFRETHTEIPWMVIVTMRNRLIHAYQENNGRTRPNFSCHAQPSSRLNLQRNITWGNWEGLRR